MRSAAECALCLVILSGLCAACIVIPTEKSECIRGTAIPKKETRFIKKGVTTRNEVVEILGPPTEWLETRRILIYEWVSERDWLVGIAGGAGGTTNVYTTHWLFVQTDDRDVVKKFTKMKHTDSSMRDRLLDRWLRRPENW